MTQLERNFQSKLIKEIERRLPGSMVLKLDPGYIQGIPDLVIFFGNKWGMLECKKEKHANHQPNQDYYISKANTMSFGSVIYPENREEVLDGLCKALRS